MSGLFIGYARVSTEEQDLTAQRNGLTELGVEVERIYVDHGLTGTNRDRPGLREVLAANALRPVSVLVQVAQAPRPRQRREQRPPAPAVASQSKLE